jgi:hypothetical protein
MLNLGGRRSGDGIGYTSWIYSRVGGFEDEIDSLN